jgi:hypothetical protein
LTDDCSDTGDTWDQCALGEVMLYNLFLGCFYIILKYWESAIVKYKNASDWSLD